MNIFPFFSSPSMPKDIVIEMLRFGRNHLTGFQNQDLSNHLTDIGFDLNNANLNGTISLYFQTYFYTNTNAPNLFFMAPQGYFDLLTYESTEQSRKLSTRANTLAVFALVISSFLAASSIYVDLTDDNIVRIDDEQYHKIESLAEGMDNLPANKTDELKEVTRAKQSQTVSELTPAKGLKKDSSKVILKPHS